MTQTVHIIAELQRRYALDWDRQAPDLEDIRRWAAGSVETELYDQVAAELARGYSDKRYSFAFCDAVVNQLNALLMRTEPPPPWPELFSRVYDAFDAGEYHRSADRSDDPIAEFTNPAISEIVRQL